LIVQARGLSARYRDRVALEAFDLDVAPGEIIGLLGPNGAGKTSALRLLCTGRAPSSGSLSIFGGDPRRNLAATRRCIGIAGDQPVHIGALSGWENALGFAMAAGLSRMDARARVTEALDAFGLTRDFHRPVAEYSLGMQRRLLLAEALAHQPDLILLDEPTSGLDQQGRDLLAAALTERAAKGTAVVMATHDLREAERLCHRVLLLREGRVVLQGRPADLVAALGGATRYEFTLRAARAPDVAVDGVEITLASAEKLVALGTNGGSPLPALCEAVQRSGAAIDAIVVRRPDLRDVYLRATGQEAEA
jgi:ABC-2 type transport system ATP-binding protein